MTAAIATMAGLTGVNAADLPARTYSKAPPPIVAPAYNWTGFYVGVNVGGVWAKDDVTWAANPAVFFGTTPVLNAAGTGAINATGVTAGGQAGYNFQVSPLWLIGIEADINYTDLSKRTHSFTSPAVNSWNLR
jgi:outer membrane immunogenic protein